MGWCLSACGLCSVGWRAATWCLGCVGCGFWGVGVRGCHRDLALGRLVVGFLYFACTVLVDFVVVWW